VKWPGEGVNHDLRTPPFSLVPGRARQADNLLPLVWIHHSREDLDMSLRYIGRPPVLYSFNYTTSPTRISRLHYLSRRAWRFPSPHTTTPTRNFLSLEEAKIAHEKHFRQLCELEAALIPFEHRRDTAKARLA
jgi:hypothetical protein